MSQGFEVHLYTYEPMVSDGFASYLERTGKRGHRCRRAALVGVLVR